MGLVSDRFGDPSYGFRLATGLAALLALLAGFNLLSDPTRRRLAHRQDEDYAEER